MSNPVIWAACLDHFREGQRQDMKLRRIELTGQCLAASIAQ